MIKILFPRRLCFKLFVVFSLYQSASATEQNVAPDFSLPYLLKSQQVQLSDYRGSVVLLDFWASWCGPCRASFSSYDALRKKLHDQHGANHFEVLAVNVDMDKEDAIAFLTANPVSFPVLNENTGGKTQQDYQLMAMPTSFLIDQNGVIQVQHAGFSPAYTNLIYQKVNQLLKND